MSGNQTEPKTVEQSVNRLLWPHMLIYMSIGKACAHVYTQVKAMKALTKKAVDKNLAKAAEKEHSPSVSASTTAAKKLDTPVNTVVKKAEEKQAAAAVKRQAKKLGLSPSQVCQHN